jgi:hypothetical protein
MPQQDPLGALVHGVLASLHATCHHRGRKFLELAGRLWQADEPPAILQLVPGQTTACSRPVGW